LREQPPSDFRFASFRDRLQSAKSGKLARVFHHDSPQAVPKLLLLPHLPFNKLVNAISRVRFPTGNEAHDFGICCQSLKIAAIRLAPGQQPESFGLDEVVRHFDFLFPLNPSPSGASREQNDSVPGESHLDGKCGAFARQNDPSAEKASASLPTC